MTGRIPPVGPTSPAPGAVPDRREVRRREDERRQADRRAEGRALVPRETPAGGPDETADAAAGPAGTPPPVSPPGTGAFEAQLLGQTGARKGLRGGPPVLDAARSAYLGNEYSGAKDRRPPPGKTGKTEV